MNIKQLSRVTGLGILLAGIILSSADGREINSNAGTSAFAFLKINVGARPVAMGGAFTGLADDEASLYYNPAGIARFEEDRFISGYHNYFVDLQSGFAGYVHPLGEPHVLAIYCSYLNLGEFIETDNLGNNTGTFGGSDLLLAVTFATRRDYALSLGVTGKVIYEKVHDYSAHGVAFDIGLRYATNRERYSGGLMLQNLGSQLSNFTEGDKDGLPSTLRLGGSARPKGIPIQFAGDIIMPFDNDIDFAIGAEYYEAKPLYLRLGWNSFGSNYRASDSDDKLAGLSLGFGIDYRSMQISYAFTPGADLGNSHRITLTGGF